MRVNLRVNMTKSKRYFVQEIFYKEMSSLSLLKQTTMTSFPTLTILLRELGMLMGGEILFCIDNKLKNSLVIFILASNENIQQKLPLKKPLNFIFQFSKQTKKSYLLGLGGGGGIGKQEKKL
uniref:Uncharacterized protein n=1 Tax=Cacopsylla melanoneura TaxID=428564 RepID=A0A8D8ZE89_9HEMI